jgi:uncharacterized protein YrrD
MSLQTGAQIAFTKDPIIDPRRLNIVAFYCEGPGLDFDPAVLHTADIREFSEVGIIVNDSDDLMPPEDLVRLKEVLSYEFTLPEARVLDTNNNKLGKVGDYAIDTESFYIHKIYVKRPLLKSLNDAELVIDRSQIVEVNKGEIIVKAPTIEAREKAPLKVAEELTNPFRKTEAGPQPEH